MFPNLSNTTGKKLVIFGFIIGNKVFIKIKDIISSKIKRLAFAPKNIINEEVKPKKAFLEFVKIINEIIKKEIKNEARVLILKFRFFFKKYNEKGKLTANQKPA